jgi:hypothetical protein
MKRKFDVNEIIQNKKKKLETFFTDIIEIKLKECPTTSYENPSTDEIIFFFPKYTELSGKKSNK